MTSASVWFLHNPGPDHIIIDASRRLACGLPVQDLPGGTRKRVIDDRPVEQYDRAWKLICRYSSPREAYAWTGIEPDQITRACDACYGLAGTYRWRFAS